MTRCAALVVAAGRGARFGGDLPKQWSDLAGQPMLRRSLEALRAHPGIDLIKVVIHPDDRSFYDAAAAGIGLPAPAHGGATRQDSVLNGLESLADDPPELVLIHDGARPFVSIAVIDRILAALRSHPGAIPALPVNDTIKREKAGLVEATVPREKLWRVQTPQGFDYETILSAHRKAKGMALTDDAAVAEHFGFPVAVVEGAEENTKITTARDLMEATQRLLGAMETRVATGFDVHKFAPGNSVRIGGLDISHDASLEGHSDSDVALHALTDALLGTISAGDIGMHFSPTDPRWRGVDSAVFLQHAVKLVRDQGGAIVNLDVTIICERPKIGPHRDAMQKRIAEIVGIETSRVSIKATTTEGLGFTGRREGIAAQATASVRLPPPSPR